MSRSWSLLVASLLSLLLSNFFPSFLLSFGFLLTSGVSCILAVGGITGLVRLFVMYCCKYILLSSCDFK